MRVTGKGQVTIPKEIRRKVGLLPNTDVEFRVDGRNVIMRKASGRRRGDRLIAALRGKGTVKMTTDEIMALTRGD
ncbi:MAG: AbrB/MazE/SpoVT family DNA-binding domain-containing protein [Phycisphaerae bacterium]